ncbi:MAG: DUF3048 domain-containing protein [Kouleothrix sp.]|jgi:hypothetical protein|nr:DUF3048 domain-containing protein [Kouleothrix sp.]
MLTSKPALLLMLTLISGSILAACGGQPSAPAPTAAPTSVPATSVPTAAPPTSAPTAAPPAPTSPPAATPAPNPGVDPITGAPGLARGAVVRRPIIVMIDNHPEAYPQSGLDHAAVVFEALAEFGVTRFMAVLAPGITPDVPTIGPVRSTRLYFAQWAMGFHALYAHAGGSPQGLELVEATDQLVNLDALHNNASQYFVRSDSRDAPHNLYTSSTRLAQAATDLGMAELVDPTIGFLFKADAPAALRPKQQQLRYFFIYREDDAGWEYDPQTNGYARLRRGKPARDAESGKQLWTKNVVVMEVSEQKIDGDPKGRIEQAVVGSGRARVFSDGIEREVTWRKDAAAAPLGFFDADGSEVRFNAGPIWIAAVPALDNLTVSGAP